MARIQLVVEDEVAEMLDQGVALLMLETRDRQTRTSFIVRAIKSELARLKQGAHSKQVDTQR